MPYRPSGITPASASNMVLGPGAFFFGIETDSFDADQTAEETATILQTALEAGKCIGATDGDGTFSLVPTFREITMAGMTIPVVGSQVITRWDAFLGGTMKEITRNNLRRVLVTPKTNTANGALTVSTNLLDCHYQPSFLWAGMYNDGDLLVVELQNVLNTVGLVMTLPADGEGTIPFEFHAFQADITKMQEVPINIWTFEYSTPSTDDCEPFEE